MEGLKRITEILSQDRQSLSSDLNPVKNKTLRVQTREIVADVLKLVRGRKWQSGGAYFQSSWCFVAYCKTVTLEVKQHFCSSAATFFHSFEQET
jgi:hypothetical protein